MTTILLNNTNYEIKDTLLVKETRKFIDIASIAKSFSDKLKSAKPDEIDSLSSEIQKITQSQWGSMCDVVMRCYGLSEEQLDNLHNTDLLFLFSEIYKESSTIKKNLEIPSA